MLLILWLIVLILFRFNFLIINCHKQKFIPRNLRLLEYNCNKIVPFSLKKSSIMQRNCLAFLLFLYFSFSVFFASGKETVPWDDPALWLNKHNKVEDFLDLLTYAKEATESIHASIQRVKAQGGNAQLRVLFESLGFLKLMSMDLVEEHICGIADDREVCKKYLEQDHIKKLQSLFDSAHLEILKQLRDFDRGTQDDGMDLNPAIRLLQQILGDLRKLTGKQKDKINDQVDFQDDNSPENTFRETTTKTKSKGISKATKDKGKSKSSGSSRWKGPFRLPIHNEHDNSYSFAAQVCLMIVYILLFGVIIIYFGMYFYYRYNYYFQKNG